MIYLDHAATAPLLRPALEAMWPYLTGTFGNPSSTHEIGRAAAHGLESARQAVAEVLGCSAGEVVFTGGGTEANNLAVLGVATSRPKGRHVVTTAIEHEAVLASAHSLVAQGFEVTLVPVDRDGIVDLDALFEALTPETALCSVMLANNEVGTVQPVAAVAARCRALGVPLHTDAVQAPGLIPVDVSELGVDLLSLSAHKFGGPKGVGILYVRNGMLPAPQLHGGGQERGRRSGTENVAGAAGLAAALQLTENQRAETSPRLAALCDRLIDGVLAVVPGARLTGHATRRLANHASFTIAGMSGEAVLLELEAGGVICSSGSACAAGRDDASHVLLAMGIDEAEARSALRMTLGPETTATDIDAVLRLLPVAVAAVGRLAS